MEKKRSPRNKTVDFSLDSEDGKKYGAMSLPAEELEPGRHVTDRIICGDSFEVMAHLPSNSVDLLIVDPPYNLTKEFHGSRFDARSAAEYRDFTERWLSLAIRLLKPDASVYVCCDWYSGMVIGPLLDENLVLRGRITWQREKGRGAEKNWKNGMEDIWFATFSDDYTFNLDDVKQRRRVIAPYKVDGAPKDWIENEEGRF